MSTFSDWTTKPQLVYPSAAAPTSITPSSSSFGNSAWAQITSGFSRDIAIVGFAALINENGLWRWDLGFGTAGNEVVAGTWGDHAESSSSGFMYWEIRPALLVPANTAISARVRKSGTGVTATGIKLMYYELDPYGAIDFQATADFAVNGIDEDLAMIDFQATADFAVNGIIIRPGSHAGTPPPIPLRGTRYFKLPKRR